MWIDQLDPNINAVVLATTEYQLDAGNRMDLRRRTDLRAGMPSVPPRDVKYTYNAAGRLSQLTYPDNTVANYSYNALGQIVGLTAFGQAAHSFHYRSDGQLASHIRPGGPTSSYQYDDAGRLSDILSTVQTLQFPVNGGRDAVGNVQQSVETIGTQAALNSGFVYDTVNRLTGVMLPAVLGLNAQQETIAYDEAGNIKSITSTTPAPAPSNVIATCTPNPALTAQSITCTASGSNLTGGSWTFGNSASPTSASTLSATVSYSSTGSKSISFAPFNGATAGTVVNTSVTINAPTGSTNLLANPGFEQDLTGWLVDGATILATSGVAGSKAAQLNQDKYVGQKFASTAGKRYRLTYWCKRISGNNAANAAGIDYLNGTTVTGTTWMTCPSTTGASQSIEATMPSGSNGFEAFAYSVNGTVVIDNFELGELP
jgi:YD repeat-containing protein